MSSASEKAADRMHADLDAMLLDAQRHAESQVGDLVNSLKRAPGRLDKWKPEEQLTEWQRARDAIAAAKLAVALCMSERDRKIAQG